MDVHSLEYPKAEFLSAAQHVQYVKTKALAYVSDFQGFGFQLSDAQVMTSPYVQLRSPSSSLISFSELNVAEKGLFGDGNVPSAFNEFPHRHQCNSWCLWMKMVPFDMKENAVVME